MKASKVRWAAGISIWILAAGSALAQSASAPATVIPAKATVPAPSAYRWMGPEGQPLPWQTDEEAVQFLRKANIGSARSTGRGVTLPRKVALSKDGVRANAIFHYINEEKRIMQFRNETIMNFRDSYQFQVAAYELARMMGVRNIPPSVKRMIQGQSGSLTLWLEGMTTDEIRREQNREPQGLAAVRWTRQTIIMNVWDALIYNFDRNQGNMLVDKDWNLWMIDHTRSFRRSDDIPNLDHLTSCERGFFESMRALNRDEVKKRLSDYLRGAEIDMLMKRRDKLVAHFEELARKYGEDKVFFTYP